MPHKSVDSLRTPKAPRRKLDGGPEYRKGLKHRHGITSKVYDNILYFQGGLCWICRNPPGGRRLVIDHDPANGWVRGLLCQTCFTFLRRCDHGVENVSRARTYLASPPVYDYLGRVGNQGKTRVAQAPEATQPVGIVKETPTPPLPAITVITPATGPRLPTNFRVVTVG